MKRSLLVIIALSVMVMVGFFVWSFDGGKSIIGAKGGSMLFVGDMMFDRTVRAMADEEGGDYLFACIADYVKGFDAVVGNLEGPITEYASLSRFTKPGDVGNTTFTFPTSTATLLARNGVTAVSLANNHILDFGRAGVESSRTYLKSAGVGYFGDPVDPAGKSFVTDVGGLKVALVGFNEFLGVDSVSATEGEIRKLRATSDYIVVFAHWGEEYVPVVERQRLAARAFVDAGADAVTGAHPHVIQESEVYKGASIYYSLGNFIFDQYWNEDVRTGLVVEAHVSRKGLSFVGRQVVSSRTSGPCLVMP